MSTWFKDTNIDLAELASVYRTPEQGVSAKSNSNIAFNDYRRMTPQANGSNNAITTAGSQTLRFDDLADTGGVVGASSTYTAGSTKGASSFTLVGSFTSTGSSFARSDDTSSAQGHFRLGAQSGTADLRGVANFGTPSTFGYNLIGIGAENGTLGGTMYVIVSASGYQASAPAANAWSSIRVRRLLSAGTSNYTVTFNISDGAGFGNFGGWNSQVDGNTRIWTASHGLAGTYSTAYGWVANSVHTIEFV
tara:strand:- start:80 stop:826 length:747 start_codon:yes stop_codon:yes gene_type:complete